VKPNWLAPAYWPLVFLAIRARLAGETVPRSLKIGLASSVAFLVAAGIAMSWPDSRLGEANTWSGWPEAAQRIDRLQQEFDQRGEPSFVFSTNYKNSALLAFHRAGHRRTYAQDIFGEHALQFDFWPPEGSMKGATGILVLDDRHDQAIVPEELKRYFDSVTKVDTVDVKGVGGSTRKIDIYLSRGYRGHPNWEAKR
jgi:hypothetical protein